jgi:hypothetical protein
MGDSVFAISAAGQLMRLAAADECDGADAAAPPEPYQAPSRLWAAARVTTAGIEVLDEDDGECSGLLGHSRFVVADSGSTLRIRSTDPRQLVVGFRLFLRTKRKYRRPEWLKLNDRPVALPDAPLPAYMAALPREEVAPLRFHALEFGPGRGRHAFIRGIDVFVVDDTALPAPEARAGADWFADGVSLFDFADGGARTRGGLEGIGDLCGQICVCAEEADLGLVPALVSILYTNPAFSRPARAVLAKAFAGMDGAAAAWAEEAKRLAASGEVHRDLWRELWRDLVLMPAAIRDDAIAAVWAASPQCVGPFAVVAGFLTG